uniref:Large ribosomal subunit protein uL23m n=1 Tax=Araucaria cunninghamii TaxID=56994 RepID=A0A0D6QY26_ARACU
MASGMRKRIIHFANLPLKLLMPSSLDNIKEVAFKTIPSASKIEIKRVLESVYGFEVEKVQTLNMQGKQKRRGGFVYFKPDYKKAYVTLKKPLSLPPNLFPINVIKEEKEAQKQRDETTVDMKAKPTHWLDGDCGNGKFRVEKGKGKAEGAQNRLKPWHSKLTWR